MFRRRQNFAKPNRCRLRIESLEAREMPAAGPVVFTTVTEAGDFGNTIAAAMSIATKPMLETDIKGVLATKSDVDLFRLDLSRAQIVTLDARMRGIGLTPAIRTPKLTLMDSKSHVITSSITGSIGTRITPGTYFVSIESGGKGTASYTMQVRPIGLDDGNTDPRLLQKNADGIYVWKSGNKLYVSGPVGHGFTIRADEWKQNSTVSRSPGSSYTAHGTVYIQTAADFEIPIPLGGNALTVATKPGKYGDLFGVLQSASFFSPATAIYNGVVDALGPQFAKYRMNPNSNSPVVVGEVGLKLGSDPVVQMSGAPLNPEIPYLYIYGGLGVTSSLGNMSLYNLGSMVIDPADPFLFLSTDVPMGKKGHKANGISVGVSRHGLIPFDPLRTPSQFEGEQLFGHVFLAGKYDLTVATGLPLTAAGSLVVDLHGHGVVNTGGDDLDVAVRSLSTGTPGHPSSADETDGAWWKNVSLGLNGELDVNVPIQDSISWLPKKFGVSVANGSLIYDGPNGAAYFSASTFNLAEKLAGTKLGDFLKKANLTNDYFSVDGAVKEGGKFYLDVNQQNTVAGVPIHTELKLTRKWDTSAGNDMRTSGVFSPPHVTTVESTGAYLEIDAKLFGNGLTLAGQIDGQGNFALSGVVAANFGPVKGSAVVKLESTPTGGVRFTADLTASITTDVVKGELDLHFEMDFDSHGHLVYSSNGVTSKAKVKVRTPWGWKDAGSVSVSIASDHFSFKALGQTIRVNLPH
jgi:hypothetical protein